LEQTKEIMKKNLQIGLILGMIILCGNSFGQTKELGSEKTKTVKTTTSYLDLVLNVVGTNLNYGKSNSALSDYKKSVIGGAIRSFLSSWYYTKFFTCPRAILFYEGWRIKNQQSTNCSQHKHPLVYLGIARVGPCSFW
jgi:hypothetical protein